MINTHTTLYYQFAEMLNELEDKKKEIHHSNIFENQYRIQQQSSCD